MNDDETMPGTDDALDVDNMDDGADETSDDVVEEEQGTDPDEEAEDDDSAVLDPKVRDTIAGYRGRTKQLEGDIKTLREELEALKAAPTQEPAPAPAAVPVEDPDIVISREVMANPATAAFGNEIFRKYNEEEITVVQAKAQMQQIHKLYIEPIKNLEKKLEEKISKHDEFISNFTMQSSSSTLDSRIAGAMRENGISEKHQDIVKEGLKEYFGVGAPNTDPRTFDKLPQKLLVAWTRMSAKDAGVLGNGGVKPRPPSAMSPGPATLPTNRKPQTIDDEIAALKEKFK